MPRDALPKRSRLLDALENPELLPPSPALDTSQPQVDDDQSEEKKEAIDALKRKIYALSTNAGGAPAGPSKRRRVVGARSRVVSDEVSSGDEVDFSVDVGSEMPTQGDIIRASSPIRASLFEFNVHYDDETPAKPLDIGGADQNRKMQDFFSNSFDDSNQTKSVHESMRNLGLKSLQDLIPGLEVRLLPHQIVGVSWMLNQEKNSPHKGGILADDMGLGKTVQMIAAMILNPPNIEEESRTTLVVVPAALLQQWKDELETKTNNIFDVHIHHGKDKLKKMSQIYAKDVIITTYHTLNQDFSVPRDVKPEEEIDYLHKNGGLLAKAKFYRVICDEAQFVRNRSSRSSIVVAMLRASYRWALTGTPVTNSLVDLYGLIRFGRFRPWNDWKDFETYIAKEMERDAPLASWRAQEILKPLLIRRTKNSKTEDGKPLLQLPEKDIELVKLDFTADERKLYESVEKRARVQINRFMKRGTLLKNNAEVLVMILRLRQLCCHPYLILSLDNIFEDPTLVVGSQADKELARAKRAMGLAWVNKIKMKFLLHAQVQSFDFVGGGDQDNDVSCCPVCQDSKDSGRVLECGHQMCFDCTLELSSAPLAVTGEVTHGEGQEKDYETAVAKGYRPCPVCKKLISMQGPLVFRSYAFEPSDEELQLAKRSRKEKHSSRRGDQREILEINDSSEETPPSHKNKVPISAAESDSDLDFPDVKSLIAATQAAKGKKKVRGESEDEETEEGEDLAEDVIDLTMDDTSKPLLHSKRTKGMSGASSSAGKKKAATAQQGPSKESVAVWSKSGQDLEASTKMLGMVELIKEWGATGDKTIVYSQWTSMLDLIETLFSRHGIRSLRYDGKMSQENRNRTLAEFRRYDGPKVILVSIKCGGIGLNLVVANRVINMDLSWNYATESQAYDRVHRLGQEKKVVVKRLVVRDTIEDRMLYLQDVKTGLSDAALGEGSGGAKLSKLSVKEIKLLFGFSDENKKRGFLS